MSASPLQRLGVGAALLTLYQFPDCKYVSAQKIGLALLLFQGSAALDTTMSDCQTLEKPYRTAVLKRHGG